MGTIIQTTCYLSWKNNNQQNMVSAQLGTGKVHSRTIKETTDSSSTNNTGVDFAKHEEQRGLFGRRATVVSGVVSLVSSAAFGFAGEGLGVVKQGLLAGRIPGLSEPDKNGWRTYQRPDDKSGGHGVGWSPIIPYAFSVPQDWDEVIIYLEEPCFVFKSLIPLMGLQNALYSFLNYSFSPFDPFLEDFVLVSYGVLSAGQVPVSIADLGGTEIDLRFASPKEGRLSVIVAPVLRFADNLGDNATIEAIGSPEKVINAFGPEVIGENVEGKVLSSAVVEHLGRKYYQFELEPPHVLITATAAGNRLYLFSVTGNGLQWKRYYKDLKKISDSFRVI